MQQAPDYHHASSATLCRHAWAPHSFPTVPRVPCDVPRRNWQLASGTACVKWWCEQALARKADGALASGILQRCLAEMRGLLYIGMQGKSWGINTQNMSV